MGAQRLGGSFQPIASHDVTWIVNAFNDLGEKDDAPLRLIVADTVEGHGVARKDNDVNWHVGNLGPECEAVRHEISECDMSEFVRWPLTSTFPPGLPTTLCAHDRLDAPGIAEVVSAFLVSLA